jgi:hypothetical protein
LLLEFDLFIIILFFEIIFVVLFSRCFFFFFFFFEKFYSLLNVRIEMETEKFEFFSVTKQSLVVVLVVANHNYTKERKVINKGNLYMNMYVCVTVCMCLYKYIYIFSEKKKKSRSHS